MSTVAYKCPNCACPMNYDGVSGKMTCPACDSQFELEAIQAELAAFEAAAAEAEKTEPKVINNK